MNQPSKKLPPTSGQAIINKNQYQDLLDYIENYWAEITCELPKDKFTQFGLPNKFICPNNGIYKDDQFYWDSFFTILGLVRCGRETIAKGMIDNFLAMQKRFNIIPMRNKYYNLGTSQIPFLTSMIDEVFAVIPDTKWRKKAMAGAERELTGYWMNEDLTERHIVYHGLSRYCDHYITHAAAEHESGWDMTSRFHERCLDMLPVDLNSALFKYEIDLAEYFKSIGKPDRSRYFYLQADQRKMTMLALMWNGHDGFFFDYDYAHKRQSGFYSVAGFYPMWAKLVTDEQAKQLVGVLGQFEYDGGLANTQSTGLSDYYKQHDYPNGWPPQHWIVIKGLLNYGYRDEALRIAKKFLDLNKSVFQTTQRLWEKYNVVTCKVGDSGRYPTQSGFAWTNAVILRLLGEFSPETHQAPVEAEL